MERKKSQLQGRVGSRVSQFEMAKTPEEMQPLMNIYMKNIFFIVDMYFERVIECHN